MPPFSTWLKQQQLVLIIIIPYTSSSTQKQLFNKSL